MPALSFSLIFLFFASLSLAQETSGKKYHSLAFANIHELPELISEDLGGGSIADGVAQDFVEIFEQQTYLHDELLRMINFKGFIDIPQKDASLQNDPVKIQPGALFLLGDYSHNHIYIFSYQPNGDQAVVSFEYVFTQVSMSRYGVGGQLHSQRTPGGIHYFSALKQMSKITAPDAIWRPYEYMGDKSVYGSSFASSPYQESDHFRDNAITSKIFTMAGLEARNQDSLLRNIYIHGSPDTEFFGFHKSHGCPRVTNRVALLLHQLYQEDRFIMKGDIKNWEHPKNQPLRENPTLINIVFDPSLPVNELNHYTAYEYQNREALPPQEEPDMDAPRKADDQDFHEDPSEESDAQCLPGSQEYCRNVYLEFIRRGGAPMLSDSPLLLRP